MEVPFQAERDRMVDGQIVARGVRSPDVLRAMRQVPRHLFLPRHLWEEAHTDHPIPLAPGATLSQPYIVAFTLEALGPLRDRRVLEVGSGSGYVLALLEALGGTAFGIELDPALATRSQETLRALGLTALVACGDGAEGWPGGGTFDALILSCAVPRLPEVLQRQLEPDGIAIFPEGPPYGPQNLVRLQGAQRDLLLPVAYVSLR